MHYNGEWVVSPSIGVAFPIIDGVPSFVPSDARFLKEEEMEAMGISEEVESEVCGERRRRILD